jgi:VWFA-related protein
MSKVNPAAILAALSLLAGQAGAQNPPPSPAGAPSEPVIHATVDEVALDLVVRDKKGRLVKNLTPADVEIYEDGVRQQLRSLRLVTGAEAPPQPAPQSPPEQPSGGASLPPAAPAPASPMPLRAVNLVCIVFHNLDASTRKWAVAAAQEYINTQLRPGTWVGVFNLDSRLTPLYPFTTNRDELLRAAARAFYGTSVDITRAAEAVLNSTPNVQLIVGFKVGNSGGFEDLSTTGSVSMAAITGADVDNGPGANSQLGDLVIEREQFVGVEGARQMDQIKLMIRQIGAFPGHKTVLLLSPGFTTTGDPDQFQAMLNKANLSDLSVYAFDANGLGQTSTAQSSSMAMQHVTALSQKQGEITPGVPNGPFAESTSIGAAGVLAERSRQGDYQYDAVRTSDSQAGLRALAEGTGGFLVANTNDLRKPFQQIAGDVETHYEADYRPSSGKYDGRFRKIEVKLARADWRVESRQGYFAIPDTGGAGTLRPFEMAGLLMLNAQPRPHAFEFRSAAFQFRPGASSQSAIVFEFPGAALTATPQPAQKKHRLHASLFAVVKNPDGAIVDRFGQDFLYEVPDDRLSGIQATPIDYRHSFNLPSGHYTVESVLQDREANRASTSTVEFDSPPAAGVGLSSLMLVARADPLTAEPDADDPLQFQGKELVPMLGGSLNASAQPLLYFVVYPDKAIQETPRIRVEFLLDGEELAQKQDELPPPDSSGAIPVVVNAVTKPGNCEIRITALQGFHAATRSVKYTVAAQ